MTYNFTKENAENGFFLVSPECELIGALTLNEQDTSLYLWQKSDTELELSDRKIITGFLHNQKRVTLIDNTLISQSISVGRHGFTSQHKYFPSIVIVGERFYDASREKVSEISFVVDDAQAIFYDRSVFRTMTLNSEGIERLKSSNLFSDTSFEENSAILAYFTGKFENFSAETCIGKVSAQNSVRYSVGGSEGVNIKNKIVMHVEFFEPVELDKIGDTIDKIVRLIEIISGRPQKFSEVRIIDRRGNGIRTCDVYLNLFPQRMDRTNSNDLHPSSVLINAVQDPIEFEHVIQDWLARDQSWSTARYRFSGGWREEGNYNPDRLVGAANMFDLLPVEATGEARRLPSDLEDAVNKCVILLEELPNSFKRNEILRALGRAKKQILKEKIRYRSACLVDRIGNHIPEIGRVTDTAVDLRNIYVHGPGSAKKRDVLPKFQIFLTDTLGFVFAASDLVESGWDISAWASKPKGYGHPFARYLHDYGEKLSSLETALTRMETITS